MFTLRQLSWDIAIKYEMNSTDRQTYHNESDGRLIQMPLDGDPEHQLL